MKKTAPIGPFLGMNNRVPEEQLASVVRGRKVGDYLRNAVNVDLTNSGTLKRRQGVERVLEMNAVHSLWGDGNDMYFVSGTTLYSYPSAAARENLTPGLKVSYDSGPRSIYWSNGVLLEQIVDGVSVPLTPTTPNPSPAVTASGGGALPAGDYMLAFCAVDEEGVESAATQPVQVSVPANGKISVSGMSGDTTIYMSPTNGDLLFHVATTDAASVSFSVVPTHGVQLQTLDLAPTPPGHIVRYFNGCLLVVNASTLFISEEFAPGLYHPSRGYIPLSERITIVAPCGDGVFVATTKQTYYLSGANPHAAQLIDLLPYGAVEGTAVFSDTDESVAWYSDKGAVVGTPDGKVKNMQEDNVSVDGGSSGASLIRNEDGMRQLISSVFGTQAALGVAGSWMEMEAVRKESMQ